MLMQLQRYHSIQAKGENVKDVLAAAEAADAAESDPPINDDKVIASKSQAQDTHMAGDDLEEGEVGEEEAFAPQESEGINEGQVCSPSAPTARKLADPHDRFLTPMRPKALLRPPPRQHKGSVRRRLKDVSLLV